MSSSNSDTLSYELILWDKSILHDASLPNPDPNGDARHLQQLTSIYNELRNEATGAGGQIMHEKTRPDPGQRIFGFIYILPHEVENPFPPTSSRVPDVMIFSRRSGTVSEVSMEEMLEGL